MIKAEIIKDSITTAGARITTFVLTYPRFIHSEFMTHRMFSRNASSSRAIPVKKQIQMVLDSPAVPIAFTKNKKGMQGGDALEDSAHREALHAWHMASGYAVKYAQILADLDVHKQYANRVLEPFAHISVVCTATDYDNFFALRCHEMAQPEIRELAEQMYVAMSMSTPEQISTGLWHLPFVSEQDKRQLYEDTTFYEATELYDDAFLKMSVARCARVSYLNHEGLAPTLEQDLQLYDRLIGSTPIHASPAEHQALAVPDPHIRSGNFKGWIQYRKTLPNENVTKFGE